jgi:tRNA uridine 5-carboxymethylaminomethyl modification enzyme
LKDRHSGAMLLRRPEVAWKELLELGLQCPDVSREVAEQIEIQMKYEGYIRRDLQLLEGVRKHDKLRIPTQLDYGSVPGLSNEIRNQLGLTRPETIGQASRIQGVTPAAVANLMIYLRSGICGSV